ncbi:hypothetical protein EGW08_001070, partial [Elysia chlorotica]
MPRKRTAFQTLARTISLMRGMGGGGGSALARATQRRSPVFGHHNGSAAHSPAGTPPHGPGCVRDGEAGGGGCINSILLPINQRYLASKGYYHQQGWPKGTYVEPEEEAQLNTLVEEPRADATSRRRMFHKTRSQRQNWSLCESGDNENGGLGGAAGGEGEGAGGSEAGNVRASSGGGRGEWFTKSMDDSLSHDEGVRARIDSVGQNTFFSTTTEESSTDSLDAAGSETERALEEIRRQYHESQKAERKESEELFFPKRRSDKKASFGDLLESSNIGVFQEEDSEENVENPVSKRSGHHHHHHHRNGTVDLTGPNRIRVSSDGDDEGAGGSLLLPDDTNRSNNYFISPVSSRQTTVEKSPTLPGSHEEDNPPQHGTTDSNDNNNNNNNKNQEESEKMVASNNIANLQERRDGQDSSGSGDVKIIVSSFSSSGGMSTTSSSWGSESKSFSSSPDISKAGAGPNSSNNNNNSSKSNSSNKSSSSNKLTVERRQQASSDSGSSSSGGTAVGVLLSTECDLMDGATPRNCLSEESDGITDRDSISRTHSPCGFPSRQTRDVSRSGRRREASLTTSCCQTSEADFLLVSQAEMGEAVNATVRRSSSAFGLSSGRSQGRTGGGAMPHAPKLGEVLLQEGLREESRREEDGAGDDHGENSKYRLSPLPTSINPLELMRRLRHSQ